MLGNIQEQKETGTHGPGGSIVEAAIDATPSDCDRCDLSGARSFGIIRTVLQRIVEVVIRRESRAGSGEDADEEGDCYSDSDLAEATAAEINDHLVHFFPAKTHHYRLFSSV